MSEDAHDGQVAHYAETAAAVDAARALVAALRTADAPVDVLHDAEALIRESTARLRPYRVDHTPGQNALRPELAGPRAFASLDPAAFFPYSPVVGPLSPLAPPITMTFDGERLRATVVLSAPFAGPPGMVHGGVVALVFDELLGATNACLGLGAFTGTLAIRYDCPTPIDAELALEAWVDRTEGRKVFTAGTISAGGDVTARAEGVFIRADMGGT